MWASLCQYYTRKRVFCSTAKANEAAACAGDNVCACVLDCIDKGGNEGMCKKDCAAQQNEPWNDLIGCIDNSCANVC